MQNLNKNDTNELITKLKQTHRLSDRTSGYWGGEGVEGGIDWDLGIDMYTLLYLKRKTKQKKNG